MWSSPSWEPRAAGRGREGLGAAEAYERIAYGLTALLVEAALGAGGRAPRFVYLSSLGAERPGGNRYLEARARAEAKVRGSALPYTMVRPSFITGPDREERRPFERLAAAAAGAALFGAALLGARRLRARYRPRTAAELERALAGLAVDPEAQNRVVEGKALDGWSGVVGG